MKYENKTGVEVLVSSELEQQNLPAKIVPRNRLMMLRYLEGQSVEDIALYFELQPSTINGILNSPLVRQEMEKISQGAVGRISNLTDEALDLVKDTMRGTIGSELRFKAATTLLNYNTEINPKRSEASDFGQGLGEGMIRAISKQVREMDQGKNEPDQVELVR